MGIFDNVTWSDAANVVTPWFLKKEFVQGLAPFAQQTMETAKLPGKILKEEKPFNLPSDQPDLTEAAALAGLMPAGSTVGLALGMTPKNTAGSFGTKLTPGADMRKYGKFLDMEASGKQPDPIWRETGWGRFADDIPRWEFSDHLAKLNEKALEPAPPLFKGMHPDYRQYTGPLEGILSHPELYARHPEARGAKVFAQSNPEASVRSGSYSRSKHSENEYPPRKSALSDAFIEAEANPVKPDSSGMSLLDIILHEGTHGIQHKEGTSKGFFDDAIITEHPDFKPTIKENKQWNERMRGMSPGTAAKHAKRQTLLDMYRRQAIEIEANVVPARKDMSPKMRQQVTPWQMMEYPFDRQILGDYDAKLWTPQERGRPKGFQRPYKSQAEQEYAEIMQLVREHDAKKGRR